MISLASSSVSALIGAMDSPNLATGHATLGCKKSAAYSLAPLESHFHASCSSQSKP